MVCMVLTILTQYPLRHLQAKKQQEEQAAREAEFAASPPYLDLNHPPVCCVWC